MTRFLGIVLSPAAVQNEGLHAVLDRIQAAGAQAICIGLSLAQPAPPGEGQREPPLDIDGYERLLDRPLWGRRELWLRSYRAEPYDESLYADSPYRPAAPLAPAELDRELPHRIVAEAKARGMEAHVQVSPTVVPGLRDEDQVRYPDDARPDAARRVARQGCLNAPAVRAYALALVRDTVRCYPEAEGLFLDWVEFTVYDLADHLACLCPHCADAARAAGYDWARIVRDVRALWDRLHALQAADLERLCRVARHPWEALELLLAYPGWFDLLRFKAESVVSLWRAVRSALDDEGAACMALGANGWAPPFNRSTGMYYRALAGICRSLRPKLFTFHWSALPRWYGQTLRRWNPGLPEGLLLEALLACFDLPDDVAERSFADYHIPAPDEPHPARAACWRRKLDQVVDEVGGRAPVYAYAHSYRPLAQWKRMIAVVRDSRCDGMWVQRYDYLSDAKLDALAAMWLG